MKLEVKKYKKLHVHEKAADLTQNCCEQNIYLRWINCGVHRSRVMAQAAPLDLAQGIFKKSIAPVKNLVKCRTTPPGR